MITLYDIASSAPGGTWSPHVWKVRLILEYKKIPYQLFPIPLHQISTHLQSLGIPPTIPFSKAEGKPIYTLPAIHDTSTNTYLADSLAIASYLDAQYPETPCVFPAGTKGLQMAFEDALGKHIAPIWRFVVGVAPRILPDPDAAAYYRETRERWWGKRLEDIAPAVGSEERKVEWAKAREGWSRAARWYHQSMTTTESPFLLGDAVSWADFAVCGHLLWYRAVWGEESDEWHDLMAWDDGHWQKVHNAMKPFSETQ